MVGFLFSERSWDGARIRERLVLGRKGRQGNVVGHLEAVGIDDGNGARRHGRLHAESRLARGRRLGPAQRVRSGGRIVRPCGLVLVFVFVGREVQHAAFLQVVLRRLVMRVVS